MINISSREVLKVLYAGRGALNSVAARRFPRCLQCLPSPAAAARLRNRIEPPVRARRAGGRRSFSTGVCLTAGCGERWRINLFRWIRRRGACVRACAPCPYHSLFMCSSPNAPPPLQKKGLSPVLGLYWRATHPSLPHSHLSPPHSNSWRGRMMLSSYLSRPVVLLLGISVAGKRGLTEGRKKQRGMT